MPPLPPNVTKAGLLRSKSGWNNSSLSRRSGTTVGLLSTRTPHSSGNSGGGIPNPSLGIGVIREAMPRNAAGTWTPISLAGSDSIEWIALYHTQNELNRAYRTTDASTWSSVSSVSTGGVFPDGNLQGIAVMDGTWIAVGFVGSDMVAYTRTTGAWSEISSGLVEPADGEGLRGIAGLNGVWVAVGSDNTDAYAYTRTTGPWSDISTGLTGGGYLYDVALQSGEYVAVGQTALKQQAYVRTTGNWVLTNTGLDTVNDGALEAIAVQDGVWIAVGYEVVTGASQMRAYTRTTGDWTDINTGLGAGELYGISVYNGTWIAVGTDNSSNMKAYTRTTGNWTEISTGLGAGALQDVAVRDGTWIAVGWRPGDSAAKAFRLSGSTWVDISTGVPPTIGGTGYLQAIAVG